MGRWIKKIRHFFSEYYTFLLISLILLFIFRPYERGALYLAVWKVFLTLTFVSAIFNCKYPRGMRALVICLGAPSFLFTWINLFDKNELVLLINAAFSVAFISCVTASIIYDVVLRAQVTMETLRGVICAYFMVAFGFAYLYYLIEFISPGTIHFASQAISVHSFNHFLSEMLYFSFVTLLTIGYGDITAVGTTGQTAAVIEGIIGQFYVAILVARIVSVYSFYSDKRFFKHLEKELHK